MDEICFIMTEVVYVEDDEIEALLFQIALRTRGINVLHISDISLDTFQQLQTPPYDLAQVIFFDLWIRTLSGIDLARALRDTGDTRPFFLVTAANNPNPVLLEQFNIGYLQKPLDFDDVASRIRSLTGG